MAAPRARPPRPAPRRRPPGRRAGPHGAEQRLRPLPLRLGRRDQQDAGRHHVRHRLKQRSDWRPPLRQHHHLQQLQRCWGRANFDVPCQLELPHGRSNVSELLHRPEEEPVRGVLLEHDRCQVHQAAELDQPAQVVGCLGFLPSRGPGGKVAEFDNLGNLVAEYPPEPVLDLAPKGIAVNPTLGLMLTTDYVVPNSTFLPSSGIVTFNTVRIWNFTTRSIKQTTVLPDTNVGVLQVKFLPSDGQARAYVVGRYSGKIYLVTTKPPYTAVVALDLNTVPGLGPGSLPGQLDLAAGGLFNQTAMFYRVGFITLTGLGKVLYFDWTNYAAIVVKQVFNLPLIDGRPAPAPNSLRIDLCCGTQGSKSKDSYRFVVTDYSLDQTLSGPKPAATGNTVPLPQPYGLVQEKGTRKVYVFIFNATTIYIDPRFNLDFETRFSNKKYNPRGISMFPITAGGGPPGRPSSPRLPAAMAAAPALAAALASLLLLLLGPAAAQTKANNYYGHYLYIWAGEANKTQGDTIFVIGWNNALNGGHPYGSIITYSSFNKPGGEPTSMSLASLNYLMAGATAQSYYTGQTRNQSEVFFWNMTDAKYIKPLTSVNPPQSSSAQDFYPVPETGGFLVTMMGNAYGGPGGKLAEFDKLGNLVAEYPSSAVPTLAPKGIAVLTGKGLMVTTDYIVPNSTFLPSSGIVKFDTVRVWNYTMRSIIQTVALPDTNAGAFQVKALPFDGSGRVFVVGRYSGKIYLVTTKAPFTAVVALDLNTVPGVGPNSLPGQFDLASGGLFNQSATFYRLGFITLTGVGKVLSFDWTNYTSLVVKQVFTLPAIAGRPAPSPNSLRIDLCCGTMGPHSKDSYRFVVTDYSLDQTYSGPKPAATGNKTPLPQPYGLVLEKGTRQVHVFIFNATNFYLDPRFTLDLETRFPGKQYNPRGISMYPITAGEYAGERATNAGSIITVGL
eukprot:SM000035S13058  [mRNA]  locus=s35:93358:103711:- [translate_table: standard]